MITCILLSKKKYFFECSSWAFYECSFIDFPRTNVWLSFEVYTVIGHKIDSRKGDFVQVYDLFGVFIFCYLFREIEKRRKEKLLFFIANCYLDRNAKYCLGKIPLKIKIFIPDIFGLIQWNLEIWYHFFKIYHRKNINSNYYSSRCLKQH